MSNCTTNNISFYSIYGGYKVVPARDLGPKYNEGLKQFQEFLKEKEDLFKTMGIIFGENGNFHPVLNSKLPSDSLFSESEPSIKLVGWREVNDKEKYVVIIDTEFLVDRSLFGKTLKARLEKSFAPLFMEAKKVQLFGRQNKGEHGEPKVNGIIPELNSKGIEIPDDLRSFDLDYEGTQKFFEILKELRNNPIFPNDKKIYLNIVPDKFVTNPWFPWKPIPEGPILQISFDNSDNVIINVSRAKLQEMGVIKSSPIFSNQTLKNKALDDFKKEFGSKIYYKMSMTAEKQTDTTPPAINSPPPSPTQTNLPPVSPAPAAPTDTVVKTNIITLDDF